MELYDPATNAFTTLPQTADKNVWIYPRTVLLPNGQGLDGWAKSGHQHSGFEHQCVEFRGQLQLWKKIYWDVSPLAGFGTGACDRRRSSHGRTATTPRRSLTFQSDSFLELHGIDGISQGPRQCRVATRRDGPGRWRLPQGLADDPVAAAELFDPVSQTWTEMASLQALKAHHSTALLLPDGRVWSAGGDQRVPLQTYAQIYSPPYLF